ncbi:hypothetical protein GCM10027592_08060 [Spirosoma flavus]
MDLPLWFIAIILILVGSLWLRQGIRQLLKWAGSSILLKLPAVQQSDLFGVTKPGTYAIWQTRKTYGQASVKMPTPIVASVPAGKRLQLHKVSSKVMVSGIGETRFQMFTFRAQPGDHKLELPELSDERNYVLEIREYKPTYQLVLAILLTILGAAALIIGIVILIQSVLPESRSLP